MTLSDRIFQTVANVSIPHFFITVEFSAIGGEMPQCIEAFLREKHRAILQGAKVRKFVYQEGGWRLIFTFFPTDRVVDERYALKNKVLFKTPHESRK
ncbi:hypothetical protein [uncultured Bacteroides sp.]|uniref:hypothetical protein n=1 Tax=uncultured Bacteroides sp. TaxID=162156 RepID=UPI0025EC9E30|nr:hypothetical protein [uncultured Bacteroides sp.]